MEPTPALNEAGENAEPKADNQKEAAEPADPKPEKAEQTAAVAAPTAASSPTRIDPLKQPRSQVRKFVYLVVALLPFVAFILLLPRGGEVNSEDNDQPSPLPSAVSTVSVPLAFPFDMSPPPVEPASEPEAEVIQLQEPPALRQCSDGIDNDRDRRTDFGADSGCTSRSDNSEASTPARVPAPPAPQPPPPPPPPPPTVAPTQQPTTGQDQAGDPGGDDDADDEADQGTPPSMPDFGPLPDDEPPCDVGDEGFPNC